MSDTDVLVEILEQVKSAADAGSALVLGPTAVHNLWHSIKLLGMHAHSHEALILTGADLDAVARRYKLTRNGVEPDDSLRQRILAEMDHA